MTKAKKIGIWMDHESANLMEYSKNSIETKIIKANFTHQEVENSWRRSEMQKHVREQHQQLEYYKKLGEAIKGYEEVVLFGPTHAKVELFNILTKDNRYAKIKIHVEQAGKMTENQQHAFVKKYFSAH